MSFDAVDGRTALQTFEHVGGGGTTGLPIQALRAHQSRPAGSLVPADGRCLSITRIHASGRADCLEFTKLYCTCNLEPRCYFGLGCLHKAGGFEHLPELPPRIQHILFIQCKTFIVELHVFSVEHIVHDLTNGAILGKRSFSEVLADIIQRARRIRGH